MQCAHPEFGSSHISFQASVLRFRPYRQGSDHKLALPVLVPPSKRGPDISPPFNLSTGCSRPTIRRSSYARSFLTGENQCRCAKEPDIRESLWVCACHSRHIRPSLNSTCGASLSICSPPSGHFLRVHAHVLNIQPSGHMFRWVISTGQGAYVSTSFPNHSLANRSTFRRWKDALARCQGVSFHVSSVP